MLTDQLTCQTCFDLNLEFPEGTNGVAQISIFNLKGQALRQLSVPVSGSSISVSELDDLQRGAYLVVAEVDGRTYRAKFVKQ